MEGYADDLLSDAVYNVERELEREIEARDPVWKSPAAIPLKSRRYSIEANRFLDEIAPEPKRAKD